VVAAVAKFLAAVPVIPGRDIVASTSWYRDQLGFDVFLAEEDYGIVGKGEAWIHLYGPSGIAPEDSVTTLRVGVRGIDALHAECEARGIVHPNAMLHDEPWGFAEFSVVDLDGNLVTFFEPPEGHDPGSEHDA
jgi:catechol 2,3-dioxygenase-like lactoylglutathione lyase family enzyme